MNEWGFNEARLQHGNQFAFAGCMSLVKEEYKKRETLKQGKTEENIRQAQEELDRLEAEIKNKQSVIDSCKEKIDRFKQNIDELKKEIIRIRENPQELLKDKTSKVAFVFGLLILTFLTVYLFIFYSSAVFSGFFKKFSEKDGVGNAIFDANAIGKAFEEGGLAPAFTLTLPFVFLALGFLIHEFLKEKAPDKYIKTGALYLVTFAFDVVLAYEIENKIHRVQGMLGMDEVGELTYMQASQSNNFILIILAGFVSYVIWGLLFDKVMDTYDNLDVVKQAIKARETEIKLNQTDIDEQNKEIDKIKAEIAQLETACIKPRNVVTGKTIVIDWAAFGKSLLEFTTGWTNWMTANHIGKMEINIIWDIQKNFLDEHKAALIQKNS